MYMLTKPFYKVIKPQKKKKGTSHTIACLTEFTRAFCHLSVGNVLKGPGIVTYRNQLEVAPLKTIFFLAVLKLDMKNSFGYNKEYNINLYINLAQYILLI